MPLLLPGVFLHLFLVEEPAFLLASRTASSVTEAGLKRLLETEVRRDMRPVSVAMVSAMESKHE